MVIYCATVLSLRGKLPTYKCLKLASGTVASLAVSILSNLKYRLMFVLAVGDTLKLTNRVTLADGASSSLTQVLRSDAILNASLATAALEVPSVSCVPKKWTAESASIARINYLLKLRQGR